jgi:hypothetical protein
MVTNELAFDASRAWDAYDEGRTDEAAQLFQEGIFVMHSLIVWLGRAEKLT